MNIPLPKTGNSVGINFADVFDNITQPITIGLPNKPNEIIYANQAFCNLTGYPMNEILGRNPRFLQGPIYSKRREAIRHALDHQESVDVLVLNYRKDGTPFWNELHIHPVIMDGQCVFYVGMARDVTAQILKSIGDVDKTIATIQEFREKIKVV